MTKKSPESARIYMIEPPEAVTRDEGWGLDIDSMLLAGRNILSTYFDIPPQVDRTTILKIIEDASTVEIGAKPLNKEVDVYQDSSDEETLLSELNTLILQGEHSTQEFFQLQASLKHLKTQIAESDGPYDFRWFTEETTLPLNRFHVQRLYPSVVDDGSVSFLRVIKREIRTGMPLLRLFDNKRRAAYLFLFEGLWQYVEDNAQMTEEDKKLAQSELQEVAFDMNINLESNSESTYLTITRTMDDDSLAAEIFRRLLGVKVKDTIANVTKRRIEKLRAHAEDEKTAPLLARLFATAGSAAIEQILIAQFRERMTEREIQQLIPKVIIKQTKPNGSIVTVDRNNPLRYFKERNYLKDEQIRVILSAITEDPNNRDSIFISLLTPQAYIWLLEGANRGWVAQGDDYFEPFTNIFLQDSLDDLTSVE